ncbi:hypothetical protein MNBD_GAMMA06-1248 [hydrothermal vent metagenome]|uniref:SPOR domain-containing protein n=1 Tax=hydrothermal vent metagenome TaxID=652676 RepID=A0A3B0WB76_9ZZZZ
MRWLFLFLFSLNLIYIGWEVSGSSSENYADVPALKNAKRILLLSELKSPVSLTETKTLPASDAHAENSATKKSDFEKITEQAKKEKAEAAQELVKQSDASRDVELAVNKAAESSAGSSTELSVTKSKPAKAEYVKTLPIKNSSQTAKCFTLGPFRDLGELRSLTREIKTYVVEADFRGRKEREQSLYWVYLKPEKNQAKAIETGKRLKAKKIKDFYVIREGEKINGLSLGHFKSKKGAYGLAKKVKNFGFNVTVEPVFKTYTLYWLDYQMTSDVNIPKSIFDKHIKQGKKNNVSRLSRDCGV